MELNGSWKKLKQWGKRYWLPLILVIVVLALLRRYYSLVWPNKITLNEFILVFTAMIALFYGYETYEFQKATNEFNRMTKIPALNVSKWSLEHDKQIYIENQTDHPAKNIYIGSFLFGKNGESHEILYDEIQLQITKFYPIIQSDILKENFRGEFEEEDKKNYKSTLRERIKKFISQNANVYLVVALRSQFMNDDETLLFFYECIYFDQNLPTLAFMSRHYSTKEQLCQKSLKEINKRYNEYRKEKNITKKSNKRFQGTAYSPNYRNGERDIYQGRILGDGEGCCQRNEKGMKFKDREKNYEYFY